MASGVADNIVAILERLLKLAGLRKLEEAVEEAAKKVPILFDIVEKKVWTVRPLTGAHEECRIMLRRPMSELENLSVRVLDKKSVEELLN